MRRYIGICYEEMDGGQTIIKFKPRHDGVITFEEAKGVIKDVNRHLILNCLLCLDADEAIDHVKINGTVDYEDEAPVCEVDY